jgi:uncharacterized SAM-binding protein YcdF (DUF218 family)
MYRFVLYLLQPYTVAYIVTGAAIVGLWRKRCASKNCRFLLTCGFASMLLLNLPVVSHLCLGSVEWSFPPLRELPGDAEAIVVLSGSVNPADSVRLEAALGVDTVVRCIHAAEVYRRMKSIPVFVSGGEVDPGSSGPSCAELMRDFLIKLGVDASDLRMEPKSKSTYENAVECRKLLDRCGIKKIILVTEATHAARAALCFRKQGIDVVPAACHPRATDFEFSILNFLPSPNAADGISDSIHEWLGLAWYRLRGRI